MLIKQDELKAFCSGNSVEGYSGKNKKDICDILVKLKDDFDMGVLDGTHDERTGRAVQVNAIRMWNVLFLCSTVKTKLIVRGQSLTKKDLDDKTKTDQDLFEAALLEYNSDKDVYKTNHR